MGSAARAQAGSQPGSQPAGSTSQIADETVMVAYPPSTDHHRLQRAASATLTAALSMLDGAKSPWSLHPAFFAAALSALHAFVSSITTLGTTLASIRAFAWSREQQ